MNSTNEFQLALPLHLPLKMLVPPGLGVHTVHTGKDWKEHLHQQYYQSADLKVVYEKWEKNLNQLFSNKKNTDKKNNYEQVAQKHSTINHLILGVPSDNGAGILRGSNWGPLNLRPLLANLIDHLSQKDLGDLFINPHLLSDDLLNEEIKNKIRPSLYPRLDFSDASSPVHQLPVSPLTQLDFFLKYYYKENISKDSVLAILGGDHSISYPAVKNWFKSRPYPEQSFIIHFDAHTDLSSSRLGIEDCFGTWAYQMLKELPLKNQLIQLGIRSSGQNKSYWEKNLGVKQYWADEINNNIGAVLTQIEEQLIRARAKEIYISFDVDVFSSEFLSCTGTAEPLGLAPHTICMLLKGVKRLAKMTGLDIVEYAPMIRSVYAANNQPEPATSEESLSTILPFLLFDQP